MIIEQLKAGRTRRTLLPEKRYMFARHKTFADAFCTKRYEILGLQYLNNGRTQDSSGTGCQCRANGYDRHHDFLHVVKLFIMCNVWKTTGYYFEQFNRNAILLFVFFSLDKQNMLKY